MSTAITIRLSKDVADEVSRLAKKRGISQKALIQDIVRRYFRVREFERLHRVGVKLARKRGIVSEEQIFEMVS